MYARLHPPALALFHSIRSGRFRPVEWLNVWYGGWDRLPVSVARMAADDFAAVVPLFKENTASVRSARRIGRMLVRQTRRAPMTRVAARWQTTGVFEQAAALEAWLKARFGSLTDGGLVRVLMTAAIEMLDRLGLLARKVRSYALTLLSDAEPSFT